jgi:hypothetical protein
MDQCAELITRLPTDIRSSIVKQACVEAGTVSVLEWAKRQDSACHTYLMVRWPIDSFQAVRTSSDYHFQNLLGSCMRWGVYIIEQDIVLPPCRCVPYLLDRHYDCLQNRGDYKALCRHLQVTSIRPKAVFIVLGHGRNSGDKYYYDSVADLIPYCDPTSFRVVIDIHVTHKASVMRFLLPTPIGKFAMQVTSLSLSLVENTCHLLELLSKLVRLTSLRIVWAPSVPGDLSQQPTIDTCRLPSLRKIEVDMGLENQHLMQAFQTPNLDRMNINFYLSPSCLSITASMWIRSLILRGQISATQVHVTLLAWMSTFAYSNRWRPEAPECAMYLGNGRRYVERTYSVGPDREAIK